MLKSLLRSSSPRYLGASVSMKSMFPSRIISRSSQVLSSHTLGIPCLYTFSCVQPSQGFSTKIKKNKKGRFKRTSRLSNRSNVVKSKQAQDDETSDLDVTTANSGSLAALATPPRTMAARARHSAMMSPAEVAEEEAKRPHFAPGKDILAFKCIRPWKFRMLTAVAGVQGVFWSAIGYAAAKNQVPGYDSLYDFTIPLWWAPCGLATTLIFSLISTFYARRYVAELVWLANRDSIELKFHNWTGGLTREVFDIRKLKVLGERMRRFGTNSGYLVFKIRDAKGYYILDKNGEFHDPDVLHELLLIKGLMTNKQLAEKQESEALDEDQNNHKSESAR